MGERGRPPGFRMDDSHRTKIANSQILNRLIGHVEGTVEMTGTQVTAGVALLKKVLPDLTHNHVQGAGENGEHLHKVSADDAFATFIATLGGNGAAPASGDHGAGQVESEGPTGSDHS